MRYGHLLATDAAGRVAVAASIQGLATTRIWSTVLVALFPLVDSFVVTVDIGCNVTFGGAFGKMRSGVDRSRCIDTKISTILHATDAAVSKSAATSLVVNC